MSATLCRRCGQRIRLLQRTDTGRSIALDPAPHELGTVTVRRAAGGPMADVGKFPLGTDPLTGEPAGYLPHWRTCTEAVPRKGGRR